MLANDRGKDTHKTSGKSIMLIIRTATVLGGSFLSVVATRFILLIGIMLHGPARRSVAFKLYHFAASESRAWLCCPSST